MSLEDSIKAHTEALDRHAKAMVRYAEVIEKISNSNPENIIAIKIVEASAGGAAAGETKAPDAEKGKGSRKKKEETKADDGDDGLGGGDDDGLGGDEPAEKTYTMEEVRAELLALKGKGLDLKTVWTKFGVASLANLDKKDYAKAVEFAKSKVK